MPVEKMYGSIGMTAKSQHGGFKDGSGFAARGHSQHAGAFKPKKRGRGRGRKRMK